MNENNYDEILDESITVSMNRLTEEERNSLIEYLKYNRIDVDGRNVYIDHAKLQQIFENNGLLKSFLWNVELLIRRNERQYSIGKLINGLELFQFLLPPKVKREYYEPAFNDLVEDFLIKARNYHTKGARRWLSFCLVTRTVGMVIESLLAMCGSIAGKFIFGFLPEGFRKYLGK